MSESIWTQGEGETFSTTMRRVSEAGGERRVTLPGSSLRIADLEWKVTTRLDGRTVLVKKLPPVPTRTFIIEPE